MRELLLLGLLVSLPLHAAEDFRVMKLEQDMRNLERQVSTLQRQLDSLRYAARDEPRARVSEDRPSPAEADERWLKADAWNRVRTGMSELQTIEILGKPTALRPDATGRRALLYTLEIGTSAFLSGAVVFADGKVVDVQKPTLK